MIEPIGAKWVPYQSFIQTFWLVFVLVEDGTGRHAGYIGAASPLLTTQLWKWSIGKTTGQNASLYEAAEAATKVWNASRTEAIE